MIKIAHLYYDLMNLYGESGNIKALCQELKNQGIKYKLDKLTINNSIDFSKYDFIYIGSGTNYNQELVYKDLEKYKEEIKTAIEENKCFLLTGNALELLGCKAIGDKKNGLEIFDYCCYPQEKRIVSEVVGYFSKIKTPIIGFQNRDSKIEFSDSPLFDMSRGVGFDNQNKNEGFNYKNVMCTYIIGPLLVRNPEFLKYIIQNLLLAKKQNKKLKSFDLKIEQKAYDSYVKNYNLFSEEK